MPKQNIQLSVCFFVRKRCYQNMGSFHIIILNQNSVHRIKRLFYIVIICILLRSRNEMYGKNGKARIEFFQWSVLFFIRQ